MQHILIAVVLFAALAIGLWFDVTHDQPSAWKPRVDLECSHYVSEDEVEGMAVMVICKTRSMVQA